MPLKDGNGRLVSVRVGLVVRYPRPKWDKGSGATWTSAYVKSPVPGSVHVGPEGLEGDQQHDRRSHGGPEMAVLAYADSHYDDWRDELDLVEIGPGGFGENLTIEGFDEKTVCIGDVWAVGEVRLQVSSPRGPCLNISRRWDRQDLMQRVIDTARGGWYLRVLQPGTIAPRQPVRRIERPQPDWTIERVFRLRYDEPRDPKLLAKVAKVKELAPHWRESLAALP
jgi:MOSC domain-containing protein YiiM